MKKVLFICTGNTCRSPMAQALFTQRYPDAEADSAGIMAEQGRPASENAITVCGELGLDLSGHRARQVSSEMLDEADLIVCMSRRHKAALGEKYEKKAIVIDGEIPDPYAGSVDDYRKCRDALIGAMDGISERLK